jgi:hypothetical protein
LNFDQEFFYYLQGWYTYDQTLNEISIPMRITYRDGDWNVIGIQPASLFTLTVIGAEVASPCELATLEVVSDAPNLSLSFAVAAGASEASTTLTQEDAFSVKMHDGNSTCYVEYKLYAKRPSDSQWYSWEVEKLNLYGEKEKVISSSANLDWSLVGGYYEN